MADMELDTMNAEEYEAGSEYDEYDSEEMEDEEEGPDSRRNKLTDKPSTVVRTCGKAVARYDLSQVPATAKLSLRRKSKLDLLMANIPKPEGCVPRTALPTWYEYSMNEKIPLLPAPANYIYYSRGKMGQPLRRPHKYYSVWDENNQERVVGAPYSALHDPHTKRYMSQPRVQTFLKKQGLINELGEVLCSLKEFNKFRDYLRTQYNDEVLDALSSGDSQMKWDREQLLLIRRYESNTGGRQAVLNSRRTKAKEIQNESTKMKAERIMNKQKMADQRRKEFRELKNKENLDRVLSGYEKQKKQSERYLMVLQKRLEAQRAILKQATIKDIEVAERRRNDALLVDTTTGKFRIEWIDSKLEYSKEREDQNGKLEESMRTEIKDNAKKRQRRVEHYRKQMPALLEKKKEANKRLWEIVRKYAMRWLEKVRKRLNAPKDVQHESIWIGKSKGVMDDTLKYLKEVSGYEKMDDFVLNIIKLKKQIQHQIEIEEAQEAAEAAAAEEAEAEKSNQKPKSVSFKDIPEVSKMAGPSDESGEEEAAEETMERPAAEETEAEDSNEEDPEETEDET